MSLRVCWLALPSPLWNRPCCPTIPRSARDPRVVRIKTFFEKNGCPLSKLASQFVREADANALDWRLLPSITFIESSGGKYYQNNNVFGWNSCRTRFQSVPAGLHLVASTLGNSALYRDKTTDGILRTYNPSADYAYRVKSIMQQMVMN